RDRNVTGVQTCALPISGVAPRCDRPFTAGGVALDVAYAQDSAFLAAAAAHGLHPVDGTAMLVEQAVAQSEMFLSAARAPVGLERSEERRVGKESRARRR